MPPRVNEQLGYLGYQPSSFQLLQPRTATELDRIIARYPAGPTSAQPSIFFRVKTPNVRMRTRVVLALVPLDTAAIDVNTAFNTRILGGTGTLWGAIRQRVLDNSPQPVPTRNLIGTKVAPQVVPSDTGLWGFEGEWETAGDEMLFRFVPPVAKALNTVAAAWHAIVYYEAVQRLSDEEWNQMRQGYALLTSSPVVLT